MHMDRSAETTSRSLMTPRSIERFRANTRISSARTNRATTGIPQVPYRWYKGENCGLWILRDGLSRPVHRGDQGVVLMPDDEIYVGRAVIKFVQPLGRPEHGIPRE